jgi:hypothetical protein
MVEERHDEVKRGSAEGTSGTGSRADCGTAELAPGGTEYSIHAVRIITCCVITAESDHLQSLS